MDNVIVSNKPWFTDYIRKYVLGDGESAQAMARAMPVDVQDKHVYAPASIPLYLAIAAARVTIVRTPMPPGLYEADLDADEVAEFAREPETFTVEKASA